MKWFGQKAGREGSRPALSRYAGAQPIGQWAEGYEAQVREAYCRNAIAPLHHPRWRGDGPPPRSGEELPT